MKIQTIHVETKSIDSVQCISRYKDLITRILVSAFMNLITLHKSTTGRQKMHISFSVNSFNSQEPH